MIMKLLLVVGVIAFIYFMFIKSKPQVQNKDTNKNNTPPTPSNDMVECASCGVYCAIDESIISNAKYYCSKECLEKR